MSDYQYNPAAEETQRAASQWQSEAVQLRQECEALKETLHDQRLAHAAAIRDLEEQRHEISQLRVALQQLQSCQPKLLNHVH